MSTAQRQRTDTCPSADALLRYAGRFSDGKRESAEIAAHLDQCPRCRADHDSVAFLALEMLSSEADRLELEDFQPTELCWKLSDTRIAEIAAGSAPPAEAAIRSHLDDCAYCRQRLMLCSTTPEPTLRDEVLGSMMETALADARRAVGAELAWTGRRAAEALCAWVTRAGETAAAGLESLLRRPVPIYQDMGPRGEPEVSAATWDIPLDPKGTDLVVEARPCEGGELWELLCRVEAPGPAAVPEDARVEVCLPDGSMVFADRLSAVADRGVRVAPGAYRLTLTIGEDVRVIDLSVGIEPPQA